MRWIWALNAVFSLLNKMRLGSAAKIIMVDLKVGVPETFRRGVTNYS